MKKVFMILTVLFCIIMISFSIFYPKTEKVLLAAELIGVEIENIQEELEKTDTINTSLKKLGIVTYINPETNQFAALGHSLVDSEEGIDVEGICYDVNIENKNKYIDNKNNLGNVYINKESSIGYVYYDNYSGIYGKMNNVDIENYQEVETANRYNIKTGKANILIRLDGENLESYEVEILAINYLDSNKNLRIKITDERLIAKTGGIVQGMSGTPVMQNGKLVGAINCVSVDNPKDAYAIFIDKII